MAAHEATVLVDRLEPVQAQLRSRRVAEQRRLCSPEELPRYRPVDQSNSRLEGIGPVRPGSVGTRLEPARDVLPNHAQVAEVAIESVSLGERYQMHVAIRLPQVPNVAHEPTIAVVEPHPWYERGFDAGLRVSVPVRRRPELDISQREDIVLVAQHAFGGRKVGCRIRLGIEMNPRLAVDAECRRLVAVPLVIEPRLDPRTELVDNAVRDFRRRHAA